MAVLTHGDLPRGEMGGIISMARMARAVPRKKPRYSAVALLRSQEPSRKLKWRNTRIVRFAFRLDLRGEKLLYLPALTRNMDDCVTCKNSA